MFVLVSRDLHQQQPTKLRLSYRPLKQVWSARKLICGWPLTRPMQRRVTRVVKLALFPSYSSEADAPVRSERVASLLR